MKRINVVLLFMLMFSIAISAQSIGDYRSVQSGNWSNTLTWEYWNGSQWASPVNPPSYTDNVVTVQNGHTVTIDGSISYDDLVIEAGAQVTIAEGIAPTLYSGGMIIRGTLLFQGSGLYAYGNIVVESGATFIHNSTYDISNNYYNISFDPSSTIIFRGSSSLTPTINLSGETFGNVVVESISGSFAAMIIINSTSTIEGNFNVGNGVSLTTSGYSSFTLNGNFEVNGSFLNSSQTITLNGTNKNISGSGTIQFYDINISISASINLQKNITVNGSFSVFGSLNLGQYIVSGTGYFYMNSGTLTIGSVNGISSSGATGNIQVTGSRSYSSSANYVYNASSVQEFGNGLPTNSVNVTITNSTEITLPSNINFNSLVVQEGSILKTGTFNFSASSATINGTLQVELGGGIGSTINYGANSLLQYAGSGSFTAGYNELQNAQTVVIQGGANVVYPYSFTNSATVTVNAGSLLEMQGVVTNNGNITVNGTLKMNGVNYSGNAIMYGVNGKLQITTAQTILSSSGFWPTSNGPSEIYVQSAITFSDSRTVNGSIFISSSISNAENLTVNGILEFRSGASISGIPNYGASSTLVYNIGGSFNRTSEWGINSPANIIILDGTFLQMNTFYSPLSLGGNVTISASALLSMPGVFSTLTFTGNVINNGTLTLSPNYAATYISGNFTNTGTLNLSPYSGVNLYLSGNYSNSGTINANNRTIVLNGSSQQIINGSLSIPNLEINNSNGVSIGTNITITNLLTLTSGNISTGSYKVIIATGASISRTSGHIIGNLQKNIPLGHPTTFFEIGDDNYYTPLEISFNSVTTSGDVTVNTSVGQPTDFTYSDLNGSKRVNRKWSISNTGTVFAYYAITMNFNAAEVDLQANTNLLHVGKYDSGWIYPVIGTRTATSTQALGVTSFGNYVLAEHNPYSLTSSINGNGTISPNGTIQKNYLESQTYTITPDANYHITSVVVDGVEQGVISLYTFSNIESNHTIAAYTAINTHTLSITSNNGTVSKNPDASSYTYGTSVELTATPNTGYHFDNWSGDASGTSNPLNITMSSDKNITANFSINTFTITSSAGANGSVSPNGTTSNNYGTSRTFTFTPDTHYHIADVVVDGVSVGTPSTYTFTNITASHTISVSFAIDEFSLTLNAANGSIDKNPNTSTYTYGSVVTLTAVQQSINYEFSNWSGDLSGSVNPTTILMDGNKTVTANFVPYTFRILQPTTPTRNSLTVAASTNITIPFSYTLSTSSVTSSTFRVVGSQSGNHTGTFSFTNNNMNVVFNPTTDFKPGEVVSVILTSGIHSTNNDSLANGFTYSFTIASAPATATFINRTFFNTQFGWGRSIASGDLDNDGDIDIAFIGAYSVETAINNGSGQFSAGSIISFGNNGGGDISLADYNNDGYLDIAIVAYISSTMEIYWNYGNGTFSDVNKVSYTVGTPKGLYSADLNNDGWLDIVTANYYALNISVFMNNKNGTFAPRVDYSGMHMTSIPNDVKIADFNSDGYNDVAFINNGSHQFVIYLNSGNGTLSYSASYSGGSSPEKSDIGDIDGDGDLDLIFTQYNYNIVNTSVNNGSASFNSPVQYSLGGQVTNVTLGDIDGDGDLDAGITRQSDNTAVIMFNNGSGTFSGNTSYSVDSYPTKINFADYDGDGDLDFACSNLWSNHVTIYTNQSIINSPTLQSNAMAFPQRTTSTISVRVNKGDGARRIIVAKQGSAVDGVPVDQTIYTANPVFGSGTQIGTGNYVVYSGTDSTVTVTGMQSGTSYYFAAFEFNGVNGEQNYLQASPATGNTSTLNPPTAAVIPGIVTNPTSLTLKGIVNPNGFQTNVRFVYGTAVNSLTDTTSSQDAGSGNSADTVSTTVTGLTTNTAYYVKVIATSLSGTTVSSVAAVMLDNSSFTKTNLKLWLRTDAGTSTTINEAQLTTWYDVSGNGNNAEQTNNSFWRPYYFVNQYNGKPAIVFNGSTSHLVLPTTTTLGIQNSDYEIFIVAGSDYPNRIDFLYSANAGEFEMHLGGAAGVRTIPTNNTNYLDKGTSNDYQNSQAHIFSARISSASGVVRVDGEDGGSNSGNNLHTSTASQVALGIRQGGTYPFAGKMSEVLLYNRVLTSSERAQVENYLSYKYAINVIPLPVELISFTSSNINSKVLLNWQTATEVNNYGFEIERSVAQISNLRNNWEKIGFVAGHGNSNSPKDYSFIDVNPPSGKLQYRLKQIDTDGSFQYSQVVEVETETPKQFSLEQNYPNPFNPSATIKYSIPSVMVSLSNHDNSNVIPSLSRDEVHVTLKIYNILGKEVATLVNEYQKPGTYSYQFSIDNYQLSSGIYFYKLQAGNFSETKKLIILK